MPATEQRLRGRRPRRSRTPSSRNKHSTSTGDRPQLQRHEDSEVIDHARKPLTVARVWESFTVEEKRVVCEAFPVAPLLDLRVLTDAFDAVDVDSSRELSGKELVAALTSFSSITENNARGFVERYFRVKAGFEDSDDVGVEALRLGSMSSVSSASSGSAADTLAADTNASPNGATVSALLRSPTIPAEGGDPVLSETVTLEGFVLRACKLLRRSLARRSRLERAQSNGHSLISAKGSSEKLIASKPSILTKLLSESLDPRDGEDGNALRLLQLLVRLAATKGQVSNALPFDYTRVAKMMVANVFAPVGFCIMLAERAKLPNPGLNFLDPTVIYSYGFGGPLNFCGYLLARHFLPAFACALTFYSFYTNNCTMYHYGAEFPGFSKDHAVAGALLSSTEALTPLIAYFVNGMLSSIKNGIRDVPGGSMHIWDAPLLQRTVEGKYVAAIEVLCRRYMLLERRSSSARLRSLVGFFICAILALFPSFRRLYRGYSFFPLCFVDGIETVDSMQVVACWTLSVVVGYGQFLNLYQVMERVLMASWMDVQRMKILHSLSEYGKLVTMSLDLGVGINISWLIDLQKASDIKVWGNIRRLLMQRCFDIEDRVYSVNVAFFCVLSFIGMASVFLHAASNSGIWYAQSLDPVSWMSATAFQFTAVIASMLSLFCFACLSEKIVFVDTIEAQNELLSKNSYRAKIAGKEDVADLLDATRSLLECEPAPQVLGMPVSKGTLSLELVFAISQLLGAVLVSIGE